jgi:hypothetical protein
MAVMASGALIGDIFAETAMAYVHMDEAASLRDDAADRWVSPQRSHCRALRSVHRAEIHGHPAVMVRIARMASVTSGRNFQSANISRKAMQNSPHLRFQTGCCGLRLEAEAA